ncbi:helicase-associated domain-containing protein [Brevibacterium sp. BRM-1]|nr:helicase-associated domain-containing protein [Brevibacterium sp. BRM-1]WAL40043.1 helicase-associated domain-containing protein [Brevibacterium sp. BRM-1]
MPPLQSFAAWLAAAESQRFAAFAARRRDLMRTDAADLTRVAGLAGTRASVATALESLSTAALQAMQRAASAARLGPTVSAAEALAAPGAEGATAGEGAAGAEGAADAEDDDPAVVLAELLDTGLVWPADPADSAAPLRAAELRIQAEAIGLLPTTAAERADPPAWTSARRPARPRPQTVPPAIAANAQAAAVSDTVSGLLAAVRTVAEAEASQLATGGIGKRDVQRIGTRLSADPAHTVLLLEIAGAMGLLGVGGSDLDPQWLPTAEYDRALGAGRAEVWAGAVRAWLRLSVGIDHVLAGRTPRGDRIHALAAAAGSHRGSPYPGSRGRAPLPFARFRVLTGLAELAGEGEAIDDAALAAQLRWDHPLAPALEDATVGRLLAEAEALGLTCTPLAAPRAHALTPLGAELAAGLRAAMPAELAPLGFAAELVEVAPGVTAAAQALLPELVEDVIVQSDLTAVATGPVDPRTAAVLEALAEVETRGQGTVYRFTESSLTRAFESGLSAQEVRERIAGVSRTGLPQPLEYLLAETAARMRRVRIAAARSVVVVDDPADLAALLAEPVMIAAGLQQLAPTVALAGVGSDRLDQLLAAAGIRTLHTAGAGGAPPRGRPPAPAAPLAQRSTRVPDAQLEAFAQRLRATGGGRSASGPAPAGGQSPADIAHALREAAAAGKAVAVESAGGDGRPTTVRMRPIAVGGGRVRGVRTGAAQSELTLAIARIVRVRPAEGD